MGMCVRQLDSHRHSPVTLVAPMPAPNASLITATTESTIRYQYSQGSNIESLGTFKLVLSFTVYVTHISIYRIMFNFLLFIHKVKGKICTCKQS